jgi:hypothetical protein
MSGFCFLSTVPIDILNTVVRRLIGITNVGWLRAEIS